MSPVILCAEKGRDQDDEQTKNLGAFALNSAPAFDPKLKTKFNNATAFGSGSYHSRGSTDSPFDLSLQADPIGLERAVSTSRGPHLPAAVTQVRLLGVLFSTLLPRSCNVDLRMRNSPGSFEVAR